MLLNVVNRAEEMLRGVHDRNKNQETSSKIDSFYLILYFHEKTDLSHFGMQLIPHCR